MVRALARFLDLRPDSLVRAGVADVMPTESMFVEMRPERSRGLCAIGSGVRKKDLAHDRGACGQCCFGGSVTTDVDLLLGAIRVSPDPDGAIIAAGDDALLRRGDERGTAPRSYALAAGPTYTTTPAA